jgi:hypothetical protein
VLLLLLSKGAKYAIVITCNGPKSSVMGAVHTTTRIAYTMISTNIPVFTFVIIVWSKEIRAYFLISR